MEVGVGQLSDLMARGTNSARIPVVTVRTVQVLRISNGQRQGADPLVPRKQLGMADPAPVDTADEPLLYLLLPDHILELHFIDLAYCRRNSIFS